MNKSPVANNEAVSQNNLSEIVLQINNTEVQIMCYGKIMIAHEEKITKIT